MDSRGEFAHSIRNPLAAVDANLRFLKEVCRDLERALKPGGARGEPGCSRDPDAPRLVGEALEALDDSCQAVEQIRKRLAAWVDEAR